MKAINAILAVMVTTMISSCKYPEKYVPLPEARGPEIYGLEIIIPAAALFEHETTRGQAMVILASGKKTQLDSGEVLWESLNPEIISVDGEGVITGLASGAGEIRISMGELRATAGITVRPFLNYARIMISEVFYDAAGSDEGKEFIEIYNDNEYECDISGMQIIDGSSGSAAFIFPEGSSISAGCYAVVAQSQDGFFGFFGAYPDFSGFTFTLNNSGETVILKRQDDTVVETVYIKGGSEEYPATETWGSYSLPAATAGNSVQRTTFNDTDTFSDWASGPPTPGF